MPNKYESLQGKMFSLDASRKKLRCTYGAAKEMQAALLSQDSCYTASGKSFARVFIDNAFDERCYTPPYVLAQMNGKSYEFATNPPYRKYKEAAE